MITSARSTPPRLACLLGILFAIACREGTSDAMQDEVITAVTQVVPAQSPHLLNPIRIRVGPMGRIYVLDAGRWAVAAFGADGTFLHDIGREGAGPGEFSQVRDMRPAGDSLLVLDSGNGRLQVINVDGTPRDVHPLPEGFSMATGRVLPSGRLVVAVAGEDSALAKVFAPNTEPLLVGSPVVQPTNYWDPEEIDQSLREQQIPAVIRNNATPEFAADGGLYLLLQTEGVVQRFDSAGTLLWSVQLDEPEFADSRAEFFEANLRRENPTVLSPISLFADAAEVGGDLWVLVSGEEAPHASIVVLDRGGRLQRRLRVDGVTGASALAIDPEAGRLYLVSGFAGAIYSAPVSLAPDR